MKLYYTFFYKQLASGLSPQSRLYLQGFWGLKLLNVYLVVWQYACDEWNNFQDSKLLFMNSAYKIFSVMLLRQLNFGLLSV